MRNFIIVCLLAIVFFSCDKTPAQKINAGNYTLICILQGFEEGTPFFLINLDDERENFSARVKNQKIEFKGWLKEPTTFRLYYKDGNGNVTDLNFWLENKVITLTATKDDFSSAIIKGSPINEINRAVVGKYRGMQIERDDLMRKWLSEPDENKKQELLKTVDNIDKKVLVTRLDTIATFKPSEVTIKELFFLRNDLSTAELTISFERFPAILKNTKYGEVIKQYIATNDLKIGSKSIEISGFDSNNRRIKLSDFAGKVVLLDFWAAWCGPCRKSNKELAEIYRKYKPRGFVIVSFSVDTDPSIWRRASQDDGIFWTNISDLKGFYSEQAAAYKIRAIPKSFLLDKNGNILLIFNGYNQKSEKLLEDKIEELTK